MSSPDPVLAAHLTAPDLRSLLADSPTTPLIIPAGAFEQHGPHLPLGTDALLATAVAEHVARRVGGIVAPALTVGYRSQPRSGGGDSLFGTASLRGTTLIHLVQDIVSAHLENGFTRIVMLNGHFENTQFLYDGVQEALRAHRAPQNSDAAPAPEVILLSYWDFITDEVITELYGDDFPGWDVEHGGRLETGLMLHLHPELVHMDRAPDHPPADLAPFDLLPEDPARVPDSGCLSAPGVITAEGGALILTTAADGVAATITARWKDRT